MQTWSTGWCRGERWPWHGCDLNLMRFPNEKYPMQKPFCQPFEPNNGQFIFYTMVPQSFSLFQSDAHEQHCRGRCYQRRPHWYRNRVHDQWLLPSIVPIEPIEPSVEQTMWLSNGWVKKKQSRMHLMHSYIVLFLAAGCGAEQKCAVEWDKKRK